MRLSIALLSLLALSSCGLPVRNDQIVGRYRLVAPDDVQQTCLMWEWSDSGGPCIVLPTVFAAGFDDRYVVAAGHPRHHATEYWYIIRDQKSEDRPEGVFKAKVMGPFPEQQYASLRDQLQLPEFTIVYSDLQ